MQHLLTKNIASLTELRDPKKVLDQAGGKPVAILNRNQLAGYFVPVAAVEKVHFEVADTNDVMAALKKRKAALAPTLDYLKDK